MSGSFQVIGVLPDGFHALNGPNLFGRRSRLLCGAHRRRAVVVRVADRLLRLCDRCKSEGGRPQPRSGAALRHWRFHLPEFPAALTGVLLAYLRQLRGPAAV